MITAFGGRATVGFADNPPNLNDPRDKFVRRFTAANTAVSRQPRPDDDHRHVVCSSSSKRPSSLQATTNLQTIPGIGPKNEKLLVASGLHSIETLREAFSERKNERQAMMDFLKVCILLLDFCWRLVRGGRITRGFCPS
jgi:hypothetical protein